MTDADHLQCLFETLRRLVEVTESTRSPPERLERLTAHVGTALFHLEQLDEERVLEAVRRTQARARQNVAGEPSGRAPR